MWNLFMHITSPRGSRQPHPKSCCWEENGHRCRLKTLNNPSVIRGVCVCVLGLTGVPGRGSSFRVDLFLSSPNLDCSFTLSAMGREQRTKEEQNWTKNVFFNPHPPFFCSQHHTSKEPPLRFDSRSFVAEVFI